MPYTLVPNFLREGGVRTALQAFYNAVIGSSDNAKIISETDPDKISSDMGSGTPLSKSCFSASVMWLQHLKDIVRAEFYRDYFQTPFQLAAAYVLSMRARPTTRLTGYIISKSDPFFEKFFGEVIDITVAIPDLGSALMARCPSEDVEHIKSTTCTLNNVQPIPLVNRMHMVRGRFVEPAHEQLRLVDLRFMETDVESFGMLRQSLAFENFCEYWSRFHGRTLGVPRVIMGNVKVGHEYLEINDFSGRAKVWVHLPPYLGEVFAGPSRVLVVYPYGLGREPKPEALAVEPIESEHEVENKSTKDMVGNEIVRLFLSATTQIRSLKRDANAPAQKLLDKKMLQPTGIIDILKRRSAIHGVLMFLVLEQDATGRTEKGHLHRFVGCDAVTLVNAVAEELATPATVTQDALHWLDGFGLISLDNIGPQVTSFGSEVVLRLLEEELIPKLNGLLDEKTIFLPDAARSVFVPSSTLLHVLNDMDARGTAYPVECKLFWSRSKRETLNETEKRELTGLNKKIFSVLDKSPYPLHTHIIQMEMGKGYNCFELELALEWLKTKDEVNCSDGHMWFRTLENKVRYLLSSAPELFFSFDQLVSLAHGAEKNDLSDIMGKLEKEGRAARVGNSWTAAYGSTDVKTLEHRFVRFAIRQFILEKRDVFKKDLSRFAVDILFEMKNIHMHSMSAVEEVVNEMVEKKEAKKEGKMIIALNKK
jgi:hypothetical protein